MLANLRHALVCTNKRTKKVHRTLFDHTYLYRRNSSSQVNSLCFSPSSKKTRLKLSNFLSDILLVTGKNSLGYRSSLTHTRAHHTKTFSELFARGGRGRRARPINIRLYIYTSIHSRVFLAATQAQSGVRGSDRYSREGITRGVGFPRRRAQIAPRESKKKKRQRVAPTLFFRRISS